MTWEPDLAMFLPLVPTSTTSTFSTSGKTFFCLTLVAGCSVFRGYGIFKGFFELCRILVTGAEINDTFEPWVYDNNRRVSATLVIGKNIKQLEPIQAHGIHFIDHVFQFGIEFYRHKIFIDLLLYASIGISIMVHPF